MIKGGACIPVRGGQAPMLTFLPDRNIFILDIDM